VQSIANLSGIALNSNLASAAKRWRSIIWSVWVIRSSQANFSLPIGRNTRDAIVKAEIDMVAYDGPTLCFVEVKTRATAEFALPQTNVDLRKRRQYRARRSRLSSHDGINRRTVSIRRGYRDSET